MLTDSGYTKKAREAFNNALKVLPKYAMQFSNVRTRIMVVQEWSTIDGICSYGMEKRKHRSR